MEIMMSNLKLSLYSWKSPMACKNVIYVVSSNARKVNLNWSLEAAFANYTIFCQLQLLFKVQVHFTRLETKVDLEKEFHMCTWHFHKYCVSCLPCCFGCFMESSSYKFVRALITFYKSPIWYWIDIFYERAIQT